MAPTVGEAGVTDCALTTTAAVAGDMHPAAFVTVKLYDPADSPDNVLLMPEPAIAPGLITQLPDGKPLKFTLPVATVHVGCTTEPTIGTEGVAGWALITAFAETEEVHPAALVTV